VKEYIKERIATDEEEEESLEAEESEEDYE